MKPSSRQTHCSGLPQADANDKLQGAARILSVCKSKRAAIAETVGTSSAGAHLPHRQLPHHDPLPQPEHELLTSIVFCLHDGSSAALSRHMRNNSEDGTEFHAGCPAHLASACVVQLGDHADRGCVTLLAWTRGKRVHTDICCIIVFSPCSRGHLQKWQVEQTWHPGPCTLEQSSFE